MAAAPNVFTRLPFMALALLSLLAGIDAGLIRIGWDIPITPLAVHHGVTMVGGFLSTLIAFEKVIPLKQKIYYGIPVLNALSILVVVPALHNVGLVFLFAGAAGLLLIFGKYMKQQPQDLSNQLMIVGSLLLLIGHALLINTHFYPSSVLWWMGFILFVVTAERLELSKFLPVTKRTKTVLVVLLFLFPLGLLLPHHSIGKYISGSSLIGIGIWMLRHDIIRIGLKKSGLTRYNSIALLAGNIWLMITGLLMIALKDDALFGYDSLVHVFFIGYVFTMIFAHGPIILPGVLGLIYKPYHPILYVWLVSLHISLLIRVLANTFFLSTFKMYAGIFSGLAILLFFITLASLMIKSKKHVAV